jgi:hypothetical protein
MLEEQVCEQRPSSLLCGPELIWVHSVATSSLTSADRSMSFFWLAKEVVKTCSRAGILSAENVYGRFCIFCQFSTCKELKFEPPLEAVFGGL